MCKHINKLRKKEGKKKMNSNYSEIISPIGIDTVLLQSGRKHGGLETYADLFARVCVRKRVCSRREHVCTVGEDRYTSGVNPDANDR